MDYTAAATFPAPHAPAHALHGAAHGHGEEPTTGIPHDKLGMWVFLCSEVMFFTGLIGAYVVLRSGAANWPNPQDRLAVNITAFNCIDNLSPFSIV